MGTQIKDDSHFNTILQTTIPKLLEDQNLYDISLTDFRNKVAEHIQVDEEKLKSPNVEVQILTIISRFIEDNRTKKRATKLNNDNNEQKKPYKDAESGSRVDLQVVMVVALPCLLLFNQRMR